MEQNWQNEQIKVRMENVVMVMIRISWLLSSISKHGSSDAHHPALCVWCYGCGVCRDVLGLMSNPAQYTPLHSTISTARLASTPGQVEHQVNVLLSRSTGTLSLLVLF